MNMNLIGVGQGNRTEEIGAVNKLEVRSVNRESTEKFCLGMGIGRASVPRMAQAGLPNRGIGWILAMAWK